MELKIILIIIIVAIIRTSKTKYKLHRGTRKGAFFMSRAPYKNDYICMEATIWKTEK